MAATKSRFLNALTDSVLLLLSKESSPTMLSSAPRLLSRFEDEEEGDEDGTAEANDEGDVGGAASLSAVGTGNGAPCAFIAVSPELVGG